MSAYFRILTHLTHLAQSFYSDFKCEQGRILGNQVRDGLAGAVQEPFEIQKCVGPTDRQTDGPTRQGVVACPRLKVNKYFHTCLIKQIQENISVRRVNLL